MSDHELYEIARERIDRQYNRWRLWAFDLAGLIASVAAMLFLISTPFKMFAIAGMIMWAGVFTLHTIVAAMAQSRDADIEKEVAKLREATGSWYYDKPKRLSDDGEIVDDADWDANGRKLKL